MVTSAKFQKGLGCTEAETHRPNPRDAWVRKKETLVVVGSVVHCHWIRIRLCWIQIHCRWTCCCWIRNRCHWIRWRWICCHSWFKLGQLKNIAYVGSFKHIYAYLHVGVIHQWCIPVFLSGDKVWCHACGWMDGQKICEDRVNSGGIRKVEVRAVSHSCDGYWALQ